jgi:predicted Na+-dependent transporter
MSLLPPLQWLAKYGRLVLIAGLVVGIAFPELAFAMKSHLAEIMIGLLFFAALRIGPKDALGDFSGIKKTIVVIILYQLVLPCFIIFLFQLFGWTGMIPAAIVLMLAASPISGSPNLTIMVGGNPAPSLRLLVLSTAALPLTVIPVFAFSQLFGSPEAVFIAALKLLAIIVFSSAAAFLVRATVLKEPSAEALSAMDGVSAFLMAVLVVGLMSAFGPALFQSPLYLLQVLAIVIGLNILLQSASLFGMKRFLKSEQRTAFAIGAGNRNMALFLAALPLEVTNPLLLYVACYQIPMYLTPYIMGRFYRREA